MKYIRSAIVLSFLTISCFGQAEKDSSIIFRELLSDGSYHIVFIEHSPKSIYYKKLRSLSYMVSHATPLAEVKDSFGIPVKHYKLSSLAQEWFPLYLYKNKYYLYVPSDAGETQWIKLTDSSISELYFDPGIVESIITGVSKKSGVREIKYINTIEGKGKMKIHVINTDKEIVIFERGNAIQPRYVLMVSAAMMKNYPILVNYCIESRTDEWKFETPNYKRLLQQKLINR